MTFILNGLGVSQGIAIGRAQLISHATLEVAHLTIPKDLVEAEIVRFDEAVGRVALELTQLKEESKDAPAEFAAFIDVHMMFLRDEAMVDVPRQLIRERRCNAEWALVQQIEKLVAQFDCVDDAYLRERKYDVVQVGERVVKELTGAHSLRQKRGVKAEQQIIVAHDLSPADVVAFKEFHFASFVTDVGGHTSHTAILSRSLGIPAIVGLVHARRLIKDGEWLIVDGTRGIIIVDPEPRMIEEYELRREQIGIEQSKLLRLKSAKTVSIDDVPVQLLANIELPSDVDDALLRGAEGIGLFRTEFLFLDRGDMPSEEEQFDAYKQVVMALEGKPVVIRTFDLGADKTIDPDRTQTNPALGLRAIRLSLSEPRMFHTQLRAILRASHFGKVKILIPMLSHAHEIESSLAAIAMAKQSLVAESIPFDDDTEVGGMIEVPAAALSVELFLRRLDFISIGTNDLIQYTLAIDRSDEQVAHLYDPLHPSVLTLLAHVISTAQKLDVPVSVCGEMAGDPMLTRLLLGLGLRVFSMQPAQILSVKSMVLKTHIEGLAPQVRRLIRLDEPTRLREALERINDRRRTRRD